MAGFVKKKIREWQEKQAQGDPRAAAEIERLIAHQKAKRTERAAHAGRARAEKLRIAKLQSGDAGSASAASAAMMLQPDDQSFVDLRGKALKRAHEIMDLPIKNEAGVVDMKLVQIQKEVIASVFTNTVRSDAGALRPQKGDRLGDLLSELQAEKKKKA